jgi:hypothetical protein
MDEEIQFVLIDSVAGNREDKVHCRFKQLCFTMRGLIPKTTKQTHVVCTYVLVCLSTYKQEPKDKGEGGVYHFTSDNIRKKSKNTLRF